MFNAAKSEDNLINFEDNSKQEEEDNDEKDNSFYKRHSLEVQANC